VSRWLLTALLAISIACDDKSSQPTPSNVTASPSTNAVAQSPADEARSIITSRCVMCHGSEGNGAGPSASTLNPKPRDFTNKEWQKATSDAQLKLAIVKGGAAVGKSPLMPPNPDLETKPEVVAQLVGAIRAYGR
jgi:cytochrome c553